MEPTDKNKQNDKTDAAAGSGLTAGSDPVAALGGSDGSPGKSDSATASTPGTAGSASSPTDGDGAKTDRLSGTKPPEAEPGKANGSSTHSPSGSAGSPGGTPPRRTSKPASGGGGRGLASLALLIALAAAGLSLWQWYEGQAADDEQTAALEQRIQQLEQKQQQAGQAQAQRLAGLPQAEQWQQTQRRIDDLQRSQQQLRNRLEEQGDARTDWRLAEAEYLLRLASLRLVAAQDVNAAQGLLEAVDQILREQPDSGVFAVREALARVQSQLSALPSIDRAGIYLRLAALHEQVDKLVALPVPEFDPDEVSVEQEYEDRMSRRTWAERMLMRLERYVRVDFQRGKVITPLMDEAEMQRIHRTLQLTLEQAQWAALRGEGTVYRNSLQQADRVLEQFFEMDNQQVQAMQKQLTTLADRQVSLTPPDIAPIQRALTNYMQSRGQASEENAGEATNE